MTVHIHTDGSCHGNPGPGGWAAITLTEGGENSTLRGGAPETTNNRMELTAIISAVANLQHMPWTLGERIVAHTDSQYIVNAFTKGWIANWQKNGWRTANRKPVANQDLWEALIPMAELRDISWEWVRGHSGDYWNELCDQIANEEAGQQAPGSSPEREQLPEDTDLMDHFFGGAAGKTDRQADDDEGPEEAPGAYNRGWRDGYEAARTELMEVLQSMADRTQDPA